MKNTFNELFGEYNNEELLKKASKRTRSLFKQFNERLNDQISFTSEYGHNQWLNFAKVISLRDVINERNNFRFYCKVPYIKLYSIYYDHKEDKFTITDSRKVEYSLYFETNEIAIIFLKEYNYLLQGCKNLL